MKKTILSIVLFLGVLAPTAALLARHCTTICVFPEVLNETTCECEPSGERAKRRPADAPPQMCETADECPPGQTFNFQSCRCQLERTRTRPRPPRR